MSVELTNRLHDSRIFRHPSRYWRKSFDGQKLKNKGIGLFWEPNCDPGFFLSLNSQPNWGHTLLFQCFRNEQVQHSPLTWMGTAFRLTCNNTLGWGCHRFGGSSNPIFYTPPIEITRIQRSGLKHIYTLSKLVYFKHDVNNNVEREWTFRSCMHRRNIYNWIYWFHVHPWHGRLLYITPFLPSLVLTILYMQLHWSLHYSIHFFLHGASTCLLGVHLVDPRVW